MNLLNLVEVDFGAFLLEEKCRNCNSIVENDFYRGTNNQSILFFKSKLDTIFLTHEPSPFKSICLKCSKLIEKQVSNGCFHAEEELSGMIIPVYSATIYGGIIQKLIRKIKYDQDKIIGQDLGLILMQALTVEFPDSKISTLLKTESKNESAVIIPVPLHKKRLHKRGYNQALEIAKALIKYLPGQIAIKSNILARQKNTKPQFDLDFQERHTNVVGAFKCTRNLDPTNHYILIDDVLTTGTTFRECARQLIENGAQKISAIVLSRAKY